MKLKYIAFDTETAGLDPKMHPILTGYFAVLGEDFSVQDELSIQVRPETPFDVITEGAMKVNKIDLAKHIEDPNTLSRTDAAKTLKTFLKKHGKLRPLGQNIAFDVGMIGTQLLHDVSWDDYFNYNVYDTKIVANTLKEAGLLPSEIGNLESMARHFNCAPHEFHNAKGDVLTTIEVYRKLVDMLKSLGSNTGAPKFDLLTLLER